MRKFACALAAALCVVPSYVGAQHVMPNPNQTNYDVPRGALKEDGIRKTFEKFTYLAKEGEEMVFYKETVVRFEPRPYNGVTDDVNTRRKTFRAGERAVCNQTSFDAVGIGGGSWEYVCTQRVQRITVRERHPQAAGIPWIDKRLDMAPRRGYDREVLGTTQTQFKDRPGVTHGEYRISCATSHMGPEDPMVMPGLQFWHHHTFVGNAGVDRYMTDPLDYPRGLCAGGTFNRTGYWFPTVVDTRFGAPVVPAGAMIYYKGEPDTVPPKGLRFFQGNPMNMEPRNPNVFPNHEFVCYRPDGSVLRQGLGDEIPTQCPIGAHILWTVYFPRCWDGENLDSADHKSHMAHPNYDQPHMPNGCPFSHPKRLFDLSINIRYEIKPGDDVSRWRLSSDHYEWSKPAGYSAHADWWNGWKEGFLERIKQECHDKGRDCGSDNTPDGYRMNMK